MPENIKCLRTSIILLQEIISQRYKFLSISKKK